MAPIDMRIYARLGAAARLDELEKERQTILAAFPELRNAPRARRDTPAAAPSEAPKRRRKRQMSAEARKRISDAQKRRWAAHRAKA